MVKKTSKSLSSLLNNDIYVYILTRKYVCIYYIHVRINICMPTHSYMENFPFPKKPLTQSSSLRVAQLVVGWLVVCLVGWVALKLFQVGPIAFLRQIGLCKWINKLNAKINISIVLCIHTNLFKSK
ncbi:unnamed protein product [Ceratitis capitata]|uniref:(Mediterranean fruit fly) hypothetical protein n=1 Tax=Ceratitis capitata TaxID=7213 RepID=A0A811UKW0_CERCA|nr:unnamed protein product [Ceratitis capitata]